MCQSLNISCDAVSSAGGSCSSFSRWTGWNVRTGFEQRLRRLEKLELVRRHSGLLNGHEWVYSIASKGAGPLTEMGELYGGRGVQEQNEDRSY